MVLLLSRTTLASAHVFHSGLHGPDLPSLFVMPCCHAGDRAANPHPDPCWCHRRSVSPAKRVTGEAVIAPASSCYDMPSHDRDAAAE